MIKTNLVQMRKLAVSLIFSGFSFFVFKNNNHLSVNGSSSSYSVFVIEGKTKFH